MTFELLDASGAVLDTLSTEHYLGRNCTNDIARQSATCSAYNPWNWDGKLSSGKEAPNGLYQLRLKALKPLGEVSNPNHTEVYTSPKFEVKR